MCYILQYHFDKVIYNESTVSKSAVRKWFTRFCSENFNVKVKPRSGRLMPYKSDETL